MLTATYTLVAMSVEQASLRTSLKSLQSLLHSTCADQLALTAGQVGYAYDTMRRLYDACHCSKVERFLVPVLRSATRVADQLLMELDGLRLAAANALCTVMERARQHAVDSPARVLQLVATVDGFCTALLTRIEREETELFPLARGVVAGEIWFSLANRMLDHDEEMREARQLPGAAHGGAPQALRAMVI